MADPKPLNRRSFVGRVVGASVLAGGLFAGGAAVSQVTDRDPTDPSGRGRGGATDSDSGANADPGGSGRGQRRTTPTGTTDADQGTASDRPNFGRGPRRAGGGTAPAQGQGCRTQTGRSDTDPSDRGGYGRTGASDSDPTDQANCGRGSRPPTAPTMPGRPMGPTMPGRPNAADPLNPQPLPPGPPPDLQLPGGALVSPK